MEQDHLRQLIGSLRSLSESEAALSDARLLERFVSQQDQAAFELLLWRHGPLVLGVCRRMLANRHDAEDAFQATFLTLFKKARSISSAASLGSWLYRVASRIALKVRTEQARSARREQPLLGELPAPLEIDADSRDLRQVLDEEINRLPARQRDAFILCYLQGKTRDEAARDLGCPGGTVSSRLTRARELLRRRLTRRGLAPSAVLSAVLAGETLAAPVAPALVEANLKALLLFSSGRAPGGALSAQAVILAQGVVRAMFVKKVKIAALVLLVVGALVGAGVLGRHALEAAPQDTPDAPARVEGGKPGADKEKPVAVRVVKPGLGGLVSRTSQVGEVHAFDQVELLPVVSGVLKDQTVDIGDRVKKGQVLATVDSPLLTLEEKHSVAVLQQSKSQLVESVARVTAAKAEVLAAKTVVQQRQADVQRTKAEADRWRSEMERAKKLHEKGVFDKQTLEEAQRALLAAQASLDGAKAALANAHADVEVKASKLAQAESAVVTTKSSVEIAQVALEKARYMVSLTRIVSPVEGVVTRRNFRNGHYIRSGDQGGQLPLLTVQRVDRMRVIVDVPEQVVPRTETGAPVELTFPALTGVKFPAAKVSRIGFAENPRTRTMRVEIDVANPKQMIRPGMAGSVTLVLKGAENAMRVPLTALTRAPGGQQAVYVVRGGKAHRTAVEVGVRNDKEVEILSGVTREDAVVANAPGLKGEVVPVEVAGQPSGK